MDRILELKKNRQEIEKQAQSAARLEHLKKARDAKKRKMPPDRFLQTTNHPKKKRNRTSQGFENPVAEDKVISVLENWDNPEAAILTRKTGNVEVDEAKQKIMTGVTMIKKGTQDLDLLTTEASKKLAQVHWSTGDRKNNNELGVQYNRQAYQMKKTSVIKHSNKPGLSEVFGKASYNALTSVTRESEELVRTKVTQIIENCDILFINEKNITFIRRNMQTILNMAYKNFSKKESLKYNAFLKCTPGNSSKDKDSTVITFDDGDASVIVDKMPMDIVESIINPEKYPDLITRQLSGSVAVDDEDDDSPLTTSTATRSARFSPIRTRTFKFDEDLPVYVINNIFVQLGDRDSDQIILDSSISTEVYQGYSEELIKQLLNKKKTQILTKIKEVGGLEEAKEKFRYRFPFSFKVVAEQLLNSKYSSLIDTTSCRGKRSRRHASIIMERYLL